MQAMMTRRFVVATLAAIALALPMRALAQIKAQARAGAKPPWTRGILPISPDSYWNAVACGKQGGADPPCAFFDTGLCKNNDFDLALFTPYKMVAYEVWQAMQHKQPVPTPSYSEAQRTRITVGVTPVRGSANALKTLTLERNGHVVAPVDRSLADNGGRFTFDYPAFAATGSVTLRLVGSTKTISCTVDRTVLVTFR
jgi:hypothetical protein